MDKKFLFHDKLILKRNDESEKEKNYKKIYDLSIIDKIPGINQEKKYELLLTIKKILLCTNKYIDICNTKELAQYIAVSIGIFILYISILSPFYEIIITSEEKITKLGDYTVKNKLYHYFIGQMLEIIFRIIFNYFRKRKTRKIMAHFAEKELNKIRNEFNINIDENSFDLKINFKKMKYKTNIEDSPQDFQYVICYPNVRYYNWDENILNENEKIIINNLKGNIKDIEKAFILRNSIHSIVILILYLLMFYCLTLKKLYVYYLFVIIFFTYTKIISFYLSYEYKKFLIANEVNYNYIFQNHGYLILLSTAVIFLFKLNPKEYYKEKNYFEIYKIFFEKAEKLNNKFSIFSF